MARPSILIFGDRYVLPKGLKPTKNVRDEEGNKLYKVLIDTTGRFPLDNMINRSEYEATKNSYDVRIIRWTPGNIPTITGRKEYYISGKKRELIKNVESIRADNIYDEHDYILIVGNKVRSYNIVAIAEKIGSTLMLDTVPVTALGKELVSKYKQLNDLN